MSDLDIIAKRIGNQTMTSKASMTKATAENIIAEMRRDSSAIAMKRLIVAALVIGNLSEEARAVYQSALETLE